MLHTLRIIIKNGVSEYISTLIITLITIAAGAIVFVYSYNVIDRYYNDLVKIMYDKEGIGGISILGALVDKENRLIIIGSTGSKPAKICSIFINDTLWTRCIVGIDGEYKVYRLDKVIEASIPMYTVFRLICEIPDNVSTIITRIVMAEGEKIVYATRF